ncbi:hypothetical protein LINPERPRIM_LOCUS6692 [Linum perenne]
MEHDRNSEKGLSRSYKSKKDQPKASSSNQLGCFKCGKQGHVKAECPQLKKERAYQATWSCSEDESDDSSDEQHDNKALMAITDELTDDLIPFSKNQPITAVQALTNNPTRDRFPEDRPPNTFQLPAHLRVLHFLITRVLFPRTTNREVVTALDTWILHHAENRIHISYAHLMLTHMIRAATDFSRGNLLFAPIITTLLLRLGLSTHLKHTEDNVVIQLRSQHVLRHILWTPASWVFTSGISSDEDSDSDGENIPLTHGVLGTPWCPYPTASEYASDPDMDF